MCERVAAGAWLKIILPLCRPAGWAGFLPGGANAKREPRQEAARASGMMDGSSILRRAAHPNGGENMKPRRPMAT